MSLRRSLRQSFGYAWDGVIEAIQNEPNFRIHLVLATLALGFAYVLNFRRDEWLILLFTIAFVLILELINTSVEAIVDLVSPKRRNKAKVAKDVSAAAVLLASLVAVVVGGVLFLPKLVVLLPQG